MSLPTAEVGCKYAGAGWLQARGIDLSPLGIRVANVVGQVSAGIYHWDSVAYPRKPIDWTSTDAITVVLSGRVSTFDDSRLTALLLCSAAANLKIKIVGKSMGYLGLWFQHSPQVSFRISSFCEETPVTDFIAAHLSEGRPRGLHANVPRWLSFLNRHPLDLQQLVVDAHAACVRVSLSGLSPQSLEVCVSKRQRTGHKCDRHPTWGDHVRTLKPLWDVDFESLT